MNYYVHCLDKKRRQFILEMPEDYIPTSAYQRDWIEISKVEYIVLAKKYKVKVFSLFDGKIVQKVKL